MAIRLKHHSAAGETRPWTIREIVQGKPIDRPTHPMFVHFPIALTIAMLGLDLFSRIGHHPAAPVAASWLAAGAVAGFAAAAITGLAERATMRHGSKIRRLATQHMLVQLSAAVIVVVNLAIRWPDRHSIRSDPVWIALDVLAALVTTVGADIGGVMVFKVGYRGLGGE